MKMQSFFSLLVTMCLVPLACSECEYPTFAPCDTRVITRIKAFRRATEIVSNDPNIIEPGVRYYAVHTSYDFRNSGNKYLYMDPSESTLNFTFVRKNGGPDGFLSYTKKTNIDGTLGGAPVDTTCPENTKYKWYTVLRGKGLVINYICSDVEGSNSQPLTVFWVTKETYQNPVIRNLISKSLGVLKSLGFKIDYNYEDIFSSSSSEGSGVSGLVSSVLRPLSG